MSFATFANEPSDAYGNNRHVVRALNLFRYLVQVELTEGVNTSANKDHVLVPFDPVQPVERVIQCVKQVGLGKARHSQSIESTHYGILVLRKVDYNIRLHVIRNDRHPVVL